MHDHDGAPAARCRSRVFAGAALTVAAVLIATSPGCQQGSSPGPLGHERGDCRADKTCDPGLICLSNLCVRPPPADCQAVAEQLASIELGNYAEPETRAPVVTRYKAACETALVSREEAECLDNAHDKWSAGRCVPRLFPEMAATATGDCAAIVTRIRTATSKQAAYLSDPKMKGWFDRTMAIMQESCEQDRWPDGLKNCMLAGDGSSATTQACNQQMPPALQQQLQERLTKAMQEFVH